MDLVIANRTIEMTAEDYEILRHEILREAYVDRRATNNECRRKSYYKNLMKERESARARRYIKLGLPVPPRKD